MRVLIVVPLAATLLGASVAAGQRPPFRITEVASTKGDAAAPFGTIGDMLEIAPGVVAVTDDILEVIHAWDVASGDVTTFARDGSGPGEVQAPTQLARRPGGGFAVYDVGHSALLLFTSAGEYERLVRVPGIISNAKDLLVLSDGSFLLAGGRLSDPRHLHLYSPAGDPVAHWGDPAPGLTDRTARIQAAGGALRAFGEGFLFGLAAPVEIRRFEGPNFSQSTVMAVDTNLVPAPTDEALLKPGSVPGATAFQWWFDRCTGVFPISDGRLLHVVTRFYQRDSVWSVYAYTGRLLARQTVDRAYDAYDQTHDGRILASYRHPDTDERVAVLLNVTIDR